MYKKITSHSNLLIKNILSNSIADNMFFVFGEKIIIELISFEYKIDTLFVLENKIEKIHSNFIANSKKVVVISKEIANKICKNRKEWVFAIFYKRPEPLETNYTNAILLDNIQHPNNVGLIIRTALGLGIQQIFLLNGVNKYNTKLISSSASYCLCSKVKQIKSISEIKINNKNIISTALSKNSKDLKNITKDDVGENWIIVFGNEGNGVSNEILKLSNLILNIKMVNNVNSLNVAMCASIVLWEVLNKC